MEKNMSEPERRFAILIDADNTSFQYIETIMKETANYGTATYRRSYGDWASGTLNSWKQTLVDNSIIPVQQYAYTSGKNSTDSAMIIDAMDILYEGNVEGFCLVSSDSDFTRLAMRLREAGKIVIGMGRQQTPQAFVAACNQFKFLDLISAAEKKTAEKKTPKSKGKDSAPTKKPPQQKSAEKKLRDNIKRIISENSDDDGYIFAGTLGQLLLKADPAFDSRNYGFSKLSALIESLGFKTEKRNIPNSPEKCYSVYVQDND